MPRVPNLRVLLVLIGLAPLAAAALDMGDKPVLRPTKSIPVSVLKPAQLTVLRPAQHPRPLAGAAVLTPSAAVRKK